ncbi:MAG: hypothetical protein M0Q13_07115 [Methanothrix sp.]|nr:hypothetical protein [Methanothrix sp.]
MFKECYALEKIHGTSVHISWKNSNISFFSGGAEYLLFTSLFDKEFLKSKFLERSLSDITIYGEAYGGKMQNMRETYGDKLRFVAFDVLIDNIWLNVEQAERFVKYFNLDFVPYVKCSTDIEVLNALRDSPSEQAVKCGITVPKKREGVVIRPLVEMITSDGSRVIAKHKIAEFGETATERYIDPEKNLILVKVNEIVDEWVTEMRLDHIIGRFSVEIGIEKTGAIIEAMIEDVEREADGEIVKSKALRKAIASTTAKMFKRRLERNKVL